MLFSRLLFSPSLLLFSAFLLSYQVIALRASLIIIGQNIGAAITAQETISREMQASYKAGEDSAGLIGTRHNRVSQPRAFYESYADEASLIKVLPQGESQQVAGTETVMPPTI